MNELQSTTWAEMCKTMEEFRKNPEFRKAINEEAEKDVAAGKSALFITEYGFGTAYAPLYVSSCNVPDLILDTIHPQYMAKPSDIEKYAYFLWENAGKPEGRDLEFWLEAERDCRII